MNRPYRELFWEMFWLNTIMFLMFIFAYVFHHAERITRIVP